MVRLFVAALGLAAFGVAAFGVAAFPPPAFAFQGENLLVSMPAGYKVGYQKRQGSAQITEMVPAAETVENWTEMVTVQVFHGLAATPEQFRDRMAGDWAKACAGSSMHPIAGTVENGYSAVVWLLSCPRNRQTGKPEITWMKAIKGRDSFYVVQKAFKFQPSKDQVVTWTEYLKRVGVCDTRDTGRACPAGIK